MNNVPAGLSDKQKLMAEIAKVEARFSAYLSNQQEITVPEQTARTLTQATAELRESAVAQTIILTALKKKVMDIPALQEEVEDPDASPEIFNPIPAQILPILDGQIKALKEAFTIQNSELIDEPIPSSNDDETFFVEKVGHDIQGLWYNAEESVNGLTHYAAAFARDAYHHSQSLPLSDQNRASLLEAFQERVAGIKSLIHDIDIIDAYFREKTAQVNPEPPKPRLN